MSFSASRMEVATVVRPPTKTAFSGVFRCAWPALLLATICLVPFLNRAFNIDDPEYLTIAQQVIKHPMHPMDFVICWNTIGGCMKQYQLTPGNSLMGYMLVPTILTGAHEWMAHLTQLVFVWIAVIATASLMLRLGWDRWHATAGPMLLVALPPFMAMASTAMPDVLATALAVGSIERLAAWKEERKWSQGAAAAIAMGMAGFARPHMALLLPLASFFLLRSCHPREALRQIRREPMLWAPVVAGCGVLAALIYAVREHDLAIAPPSSVIMPEHLWRNLFSYLLYFAFPLPLAACWLGSRFKGVRGYVVYLLLAAFALPPMPMQMAGLLILIALGCSVLIFLCFDAARNFDHTGLFLILWVLIPLPIIFYAHLPMKYLLPCFPALILLCFRLLERKSIQWARVAIIALVAVSTCYSFLILRSDAEFANFGRDALFRLIAPHVSAGERVWYPGHYWSYWYAPLDGATLTYAGGPQPRPGDLLVVDVMADEGLPRAAQPLTRFPHRTLVGTATHKYRFGRTMSSGGGLYSDGWWMWWLGKSDDDRFELWRID